jgi:SAM-dependent methyltransferase
MKTSTADYNEFYDPRLVEVYDTVCALGDDKKFFLDVIQGLNINKIIDLGCGTGLLTCELSKLGYQVIGVEPSEQMLQQARQSSCGQDVEWIQGDGLSLEKHETDLVIMTSHVAQFHLEDDYWVKVLQKINDSLKSGGYVLFDTRNPDVQPWVREDQEDNVDFYAPNFCKKVVDPKKGEIEVWLDEPIVDGKNVTTTMHYLFKKNGEELTTTNTLAFRSRKEVENQLKEAGFTVQTVYGNWDASLATSDSPEFVFVGKKVL